MIFNLVLKDERVEQCLRSCGSEFQLWGSKAKEGAKATSLAFVFSDFQHTGVRRRAPCTRRSVDM